MSETLVITGAQLLGAESADIIIEDGRIAEDVTIDLRRPRRRGSAELAALEGEILKHLLEGSEDTSGL